MVTAHCRPRGHMATRCHVWGHWVALGNGGWESGPARRERQISDGTRQEIIKACFRLTSNLVQVPMFRTPHCKGCPLITGRALLPVRRIQFLSGPGQTINPGHDPPPRLMDKRAPAPAPARVI